MTSELSDQARAMLERALVEERPLLPGAGQRARLKRSLLQGAVVAGAGKAAAGPLAAGAATQGAATGVVALLPLAKGIGMGLLLTAGAAFGPRIFSAPPAAPLSTPSALPAPRVVPANAAPAKRNEAAPPPASPVADANQAPVAATPTARVGSSAPSTSAEPVAGLAAELQLLSSAQTALRDGHGAAALELLERYDRTFPNGQLRSERLAAEVFAACQSGDRARAVRAADRFLQRDDSSVLAERVRRSCAFKDAGQPP
jgi:hypothetical protein